MNILVTAGNTQVPIDRVRCLTNIFSGRTGASIAIDAYQCGHQVTLLTSSPETIAELHPSPAPDRLRVARYRTFDELNASMAKGLQTGSYDALIHTAAVSDYLASGVFASAQGSSFSSRELTWSGNPPTMLDRAAAKVKSDEPELWLRLVRAPKLVDKVRTDWGFKGILVKFKLEVNVDEKQLLAVAEASRLQSGADLMVANTLEGMHEWALLGPLKGGYERNVRGQLSPRLIDAVQRLHEERTHG